MLSQRKSTRERSSGTIDRCADSVTDYTTNTRSQCAGTAPRDDDSHCRLAFDAAAGDAPLKALSREPRGRELPLRQAFDQVRLEAKHPVAVARELSIAARVCRLPAPMIPAGVDLDNELAGAHGPESGAGE